ncbi:hypothetical protein ACMD2_26465 [Ananas comosus]|uniref:Uncharacterized protein n=1 Tax=Ananas comosus TaxID=4615 RepID=A0A199UTY4_ANACO|nr:hypothetical protein ACMD2_26465 [Ananas comosus]
MDCGFGIPSSQLETLLLQKAPEYILLKVLQAALLKKLETGQKGSIVYELHRLYRIQKDLMEEFQRKELHGYSIPADTSQSNSITSSNATPAECK